MNKNKHYLISDASRQVQVEAHVLRYWEDELGLPIPRNEQGHRYYTEFHIQLFRQIKQLKEQGYQLKAIRGILGKWKKIRKQNRKRFWKRRHRRFSGKREQESVT